MRQPTALHDRASPRPQPGRDRSINGCQRYAARDIHVAVDHLVPGSQLIPIDRPRRESLRAQKWHVVTTVNVASWLHDPRK